MTLTTQMEEVKMLYTTLKQIKKCGPCGQDPEPDGSLRGWLKLLSYLGKTYSDDEPLGFDVILESNGLDDALWCLRSVDGYDREIRLLACDYAEHVLPIYEKIYPDTRLRNFITTWRKYANGEATIEELHAAAATVYAAAYADYADYADYDGVYADACAFVYSAAAHATDAVEMEWQHEHFIDWLNQIGENHAE